MKSQAEQLKFSHHISTHAKVMEFCIELLKEAKTDNEKIAVLKIQEMANNWISNIKENYAKSE